jgi:Flp pilus assembly protein TadG
MNISSHKLLDQKGSTIVLVAVSLVALIAFVSLAVDVGYMLIARNELQNAADAAALAGTRYMGKMAYEGKQLPVNLSTYQAAIISAAKNAALNNSVAGTRIATINDSDVIIGKWDNSTTPPSFTAGLENANAVRVTVRRESGSNGTIPTFFAGIFQINAAEANAEATAALTGEGQTLPGQSFPIALSQQIMDIACPPGSTSPVPITLTPGANSCFAWFSWDGPTNKGTVADMLDGTDQRVMAVGSTAVYPNCGIPPYAPCSTIALTNGIVDSIFNPNEPINDYIGKEVTVPIYKETSTCSNISRPANIIGFGILEVKALSKKDKSVSGDIRCGYVDQGRGSGTYYGAIGSIPGLVR